MPIKEHVVMRDYTTFHVGGVADYFFEAKTIEDLIKTVNIAKKLNIPFFILGNGSNVLFSDFGYAGLVIKNSTSHIALMKETSQAIVDSGVTLGRLIMELASNNLSGLEFLSGVPGTIGGAIYGNAGAWGHAIGDYVKNVTVLEYNDQEDDSEIKQYDSSWLEFSYRSSKLKTLKGKSKPVILSARLQLSQNQKEEIIRRINSAKIEREKAQPVGFSAGSIFRNPIPKEIENLTGAGSKFMPEIPKERTAGYMLEQAGVKRLKVGLAEVSSKHANFIINSGGAKSSEIRTLIEDMRDRVNKKFGVVLEEEIEYVGQW